MGLNLPKRKITQTMTAQEGYDRYSMVVQLSTFRGEKAYNVCMFKNLKSLKNELEPFDETAVKPSEEFMAEFGELLQQGQSGQVELTRLEREGSKKQMELLKEYKLNHQERRDHLKECEIEVIQHVVLEDEVPAELSGADLGILDQIGLMVTKLPSELKKA